ncbi:RagB/SusD family nutrient uptake outer membrane protein [termite gut metagenome]|uniref:RagB/SusD family nutrient uptake outer membrane protein n=1 Tax=termite gut metagenome TaxID=433724 RepID=A0A5J4S0Z9_9ZZZZ
MKTSKLLYAFAIAFSLLLAGCNDFLDITPNDRITGDNFYQNEDDFKAATAPLYNKVWFDFNDKFYYGLGDGRSYNLYAPYSDYIYPFSDLAETGLTGPLVLAWQSFYNVIQQSNKVIIGITGSSVSESVKNQYMAEARFMRGVAYWYLASLWGNVIISEDSGVLINNQIVNTNPRTDVFEFVIYDLEYAAKYLPETVGQSGRLTKYSAYGMLSRVYLSYAGLSSNPNSHTRNQTYLDLAKKAAQTVITESKYKLMPDYASLFMIENNNNSESMFALQWVPNGDYGVTNTQQAYFAYNSAITGDDAAWGAWTRATYDVLKEYETGDFRRKATWMSMGDYYSEIGKAAGGFTFEESDQYCNVKKGVVGSTKDNPSISRMNSALNTYMMRLAEVYLIYAEATLGNAESTADAEALAYFNQVRTRAGLNAKTSLTYKDIIHERLVEFCMEGQYWYDLIRRAYYEQQEVINYIVSQDRGTISPILYDTTNNTVKIDSSRDPDDRAIGNIDESIFLLPYPESELVQNPLLKELPVPYEFTEERITDLF